MKRTLFFALLVTLLFVLPLFTFSTSALSAKTVTSVNLTGPYSVEEASRTQFNAVAYFSDGTSLNVNAVALWYDNSPYTNLNKGLMVVKMIPATHTAVLTVSYTYLGTTVTDSQSVLVIKL
jgi:hypothetical protein